MLANAEARAMLVFGRGNDSRGALSISSEKVAEKAAQLIVESPGRHTNAIFPCKHAVRSDPQEKTEAERLMAHAIMYAEETLGEKGARVLISEIAILEEQSMDTLGACYHVHPILTELQRQKGITALTVVSIDYHKRRVEYACRQFWPDYELEFVAADSRLWEADLNAIRVAEETKLARYKLHYDDCVGAEEMMRRMEMVHDLFAKREIINALHK